jgi:DNA-directed RNA polymerase subunit D
MRLTVKEMTDTNALLLVEGAHASVLNSLRRVMIGEVPKMAIEDVTVYDNTSALFDEMVAHRLGLLPIPTDLQAFVPRAQCTCNNEGCANCTILYTLSKEGPGMVTSGDLTPADPRFRIKDDKIPIVKLLEGQRVMLECAAILGTGATHSKWIPVTAVGYREIPHVEIKASPPIPAATLVEIQKTAPPGSVAVEDGKLRVLDEIKAWDYLRSAKGVYDIESVVLTTDKDNWLMTVETDGALSPKEVLQRGLHILMEKLKDVEQDVVKLKAEEATPAA